MVFATSGGYSIWVNTRAKAFSVRVCTAGEGDLAGSVSPRRFLWKAMGMRIGLIAIAALILGSCEGSAPFEQGVPLVTEVTRAPWNSSRSTGQVLTTKHYRIYTTATRPETARYLPAFMEAGHQNYLSLTHLPDRPATEPLTIYMMATRAEWALLTESVIERGKEKYLAIEAGGYFYNGVCVFWDIGGGGTFSVAAHEGLHQFLASRLAERLPTWLEEGLCVSAEGHQFHGDRVLLTPNRNPLRLGSLRTAIVQGHWLPIDKLLRTEPGDVVTQGTRKAVSYYSQLWALSVFIRTHSTYSEGVKRLIRDAEMGRIARTLGVTSPEMSRLKSRPRAHNRALRELIFRHYINEDLAAFDREYLAFANDLCGLEN
jgi:hypothetical protein